MCSVYTCMYTYTHDIHVMYVCHVYVMVYTCIHIHVCRVLTELYTGLTVTFFNFNYKLNYHCSCTVELSTFMSKSKTARLPSVLICSTRYL